MSKSFDISKFITNKCVVKNENVLDSISNDFHMLDISFIKPENCGNYIKTTTSDLSSILFSIIDEFGIEVSVFPLIGFDRVKWYSRTIESGDVLLAVVPSSPENSIVSFLGVVK